MIRPLHLHQPGRARWLAAEAEALLQVRLTHQPVAKPARGLHVADVAVVMQRRVQFAPK